MGDSTKDLTQLEASQANKETTINELFDACSPAALYGRNATTSTGLTFGYYGGRWSSIDINNGTVTVGASATTYMVANNTTGVVSVSTGTTNWNSGSYTRLYKLVSGTSTITSYEDHRQAIGGSGGGGGGGTGVVETIVAGTGVTVDSTDPANPIVSATGNGRDLLSGSIAYYVRTDGSDSNDGLSNSAGGAFLTIQHAIDIANRTDFSGHEMSINIADGTYAESLFVDGLIGGGSLLIIGNTTTPANVAITGAGDPVLNVYNSGTIVDVTGVYFNSSSTTSLAVGNASVITRNVRYGATTAYHIEADKGARVTVAESYAIAGNAQQHLRTIGGSQILYDDNSVTVTLTGTPAFSSAFAFADSNSLIDLRETAFSGLATGKRFTVQNDSQINTGLRGINYLPGNAAGTVEAGSIYDSITLQGIKDFSQNQGTTTGLTYGFHGGAMRSDNVTTVVSDGTVSLTSSSTNYVEATGAGVVSANTTGFTAGRFPMAQIVTGASTITSVTDKRGFASVASSSGGGISLLPSQITTSGVTKSFTGIPAGAKRITLSLSGVSTSGSGGLTIQRGTAIAGLVGTGYDTVGGPILNAAATSLAASTAGFRHTSVAANTFSGTITFERLDLSTHRWSARGLIAATNTAAIVVLAGSVTLADPVDRVGISTTNGTDTFDAGIVGASYET